MRRTPRHVRNDVGSVNARLHMAWRSKETVDDWDSWLAWCVWHGAPTLVDPLYSEDRLFRIETLDGEQEWVPYILPYETWAYRWGDSVVSWQCPPFQTGEQVGATGLPVAWISYDADFSEQQRSDGAYPSIDTHPFMTLHIEPLNGEENEILHGQEWL